MFYLYCIRPKTSSKFSLKGIDGRRTVSAIPYKDIEAIVSALSQSDFDLEEISKKAKDDLAWIKEKAQLHEAIIESVMSIRKDERGAVHPAIPMKFGTIFKNRGNLEKSLAAHYQKFSKTLQKLRGKQEWNLKIYLADSRVLENSIREENEEIRAKEKEMASMSEGRAYFAEKEIETMALRKKERKFQDIRAHIVKNLRPYLEAQVQGKILDKGLTGRPEPMIFNVSFLVKEENLKDFKKMIENFAKDLPAFTFEYSGPWPPYHFV